MTLTREQIINDIPRLMAEKTNREIAEELGVKIYTIEYWIKQLRRKGYEVPERRRRGRKPRI